MTNTLELAWVAGFLEGEGSFYFKKGGKPSEILVSVVQVQKEPIERLLKYFGGACYLATQDKRKRYKYTCAPQWNWRLNGYRAAALMMTLYVFMSPKRQDQIIAALDHWKSAKSTRRPRTSPFCLHGHVLAEVGTTKKGACRACKRKDDLAAYHRKRERLRSGVDS